MAKKGNITAANASAVMTVDEVYPQGFPMESFATDVALEVDAEVLAETRMGIDGRMSAGYVPSIKVVTVTLEPHSASTPYLDRVAARSRNNMEVYNVELVFNVPALKQVWTYSDGVLQTITPTPGIKKTLDPRPFIFHFGHLDIQDV